jgi:hypothetical protein
MCNDWEICFADQELRHSEEMVMMRKVLLAVGLLAGAALIVPADTFAKGGKGGDGNSAPGDHGKGGGEGNHGKGGHNGKHGKGGRNGGGGGEHCFKPSVLQQILRDNPGLPKNFLTHSPPDTPIKLGDGNTYPLYRLDQFLQANFRIEWYARQKDGEDIVKMMAERLRKLMALPDFHELVKTFRGQYRISPMGKVSSEQAYDHFRHCHRRIGVTAGKQYHAPVGGGGGIAAPSWAVWKAMNIFEHETCHCIGIGHDSGGLSGPIAGKLRQWDHKKKWNYSTIDANTLVATAKQAHAKPSDTKVKGNKGGNGKKNNK